MSKTFRRAHGAAKNIKSSPVCSRVDDCNRYSISCLFSIIDAYVRMYHVFLLQGKQEMSNMKVTKTARKSLWIKTNNRLLMAQLNSYYFLERTCV